MKEETLREILSCESNIKSLLESEDYLGLRISPRNTLLGSTLIFLCPLLFVLSSKPSTSVSVAFDTTRDPLSALPSRDLFFA